MRAEVQRYYGEVLKSSADLKTTACCTEDAPPEHVKGVLAEIHDEVVRCYSGCGLVLPEATARPGEISAAHLAPFFEFVGAGGTHYGIFDGCGKALPVETWPKGGAAPCC